MKYVIEKELKIKNSEGEFIFCPDSVVDIEKSNIFFDFLIINLKNSTNYIFKSLTVTIPNLLIYVTKKDFENFIRQGSLSIYYENVETDKPFCCGIKMNYVNGAFKCSKCWKTQF